MTDTTLPADLKQGRELILAETGLAADDVGALPNAAHKAGGGYHCGVQDIKNIGEYPDGDYSTRQMRDRIGGNACAAIDVGDNWPRGGRAAWLRFNNWLVELMRAGDPELVALRAANFSPDGSLRRRYDSLHPEAGIIASTDTVYMHTHLEWWRNTAGIAARWISILRVVQVIRAAIDNDKGMLSMTASEFHTGEANGPFLTQGTWAAGNQRDTAMAFTWQNTQTILELLQLVASKVDLDPAELDAIQARAKAGAAAALAEAQESFVNAIVAALPEPQVPAGGDGQPGYTLGQITDALRSVFADAGTADA